MSDIVERLRAWDAWDPPIGFDERKGHVAPQHVSGAEAADEIERLRSLLKEAGEALELIAKTTYGTELSSSADERADVYWSHISRFQSIARTVLSKIKGEV